MPTATSIPEPTDTPEPTATHTPAPTATFTPTPTALPVGDRGALIALYNSADGPNWKNNANWLSDEPLNRWYGVTAVGDRVTELDLGGNGLKGVIPPELSRLTMLQILNLGYGEMYGSIPAWLADLSHLRHILLAGNALQGELPAELGNLDRLNSLTLSGNAGVVGVLPDAMTNLNRIQWLTFHETALCAPFDESFRAWLDEIEEWEGTDCPPGLTEIHTPTVSRYPIATRQQGYGYTIDVPDDWIEDGRYIRSVPDGELLILELDLPSETKLEEFAESAMDNLKQEWSMSAWLFEMTSFEKRREDDQDFYIMEYRLQENSWDCVKETVELIALGSNLPGPTRGFRLRHHVCDSELSTNLDRVRRETLESFRIAIEPDAYYNQFLSRPGVTIKAAGKVNPAALHNAAGILDVMLEGRDDIPDCLGRIGSALAIVPDGDPLTALPEFAHLRDIGGETGAYLNSVHAPGAGGGWDSPVSATPEQMLRGPAGHPPFRDVHEPGHHLQICFTDSDNREWVDLYRRAVEKVGDVTEYDEISSLVTSNNYEFWAGFASFYFFVHDAPRRYAKQLFPEAYSFVEKFYGLLTPTKSAHQGYIQYVTASGIPLPWLVPGGEYQNNRFGYSIDLLPGWVVEREHENGVLLASRNWPWPQIRIDYTRIRDGADVDEALVRLAESRRNDWQRRTRDWHQSHVKSFERLLLDGHDTYWLRYYSQESPADCEENVIERVLVTKHGGENYGVVLEGTVCGEGSEFVLQDFEIMLRSFILPTSTRTPTPEPTPTHTPTPDTTSSETVRLERDALVALYYSTGGPHWNHRDNWLSDEPLNRWYGIEIFGGRVTALHLGGNDLRGVIPPELGNLTQLRELWFGDGNNLTGELPSELSRLTELEVLDLGYSDVSGSIPAWLGELTRLRSLYLDGNQFRGELPEELGNLTRLDLLTLHDNQGLSGELPGTLTKLRELEWFPFHGTGLCAPLTDSFQAWLNEIRDWEGPNCLSVSTAVSDHGGDVIVRDIFGRVVNEKGIVLVDWEGQIANPAMKYTVELPRRSATLSSSEPRLYFDLPSTIGAYGPSKLLTQKDSAKSAEFRLSIFPDRDTIDEHHLLTIRYSDAQGQLRTQTLDVHVIDQDVDFSLEFNIIADFSYDETGFFGDRVARATIQEAADDFAYFIADMNLDEVRVGEESMWINESGDPNNPRDWGVGEWVSNRVAYTGFWLGVYGNYRNEGGPGGGGQPSGSGRNQSSRGKEYPTKRSGIVDINPKGNWSSNGWMKSPDEGGWWESESGSNVKADLYSIALHEIGHALVFNPGHDGFSGFKDALEVRDPALAVYYGSNPHMDRTDHFFDSIDPVSLQGAFGNEYGGQVPNGRWIVTKFDLLVAQATGYILRDTSPFRDLSLPDQTLVNGKSGDEYSHKIGAVGGIPAYYWTIDSGMLPEGLSLDSFTGTISGTPIASGTFRFTVRVRDQTDGHLGVTRDVTMIVQD